MIFQRRSPGYSRRPSPPADHPAPLGSPLPGAPGEPEFVKGSLDPGKRQKHPVGYSKCYSLQGRRAAAVPGPAVTQDFEVCGPLVG